MANYTALLEDEGGQTANMEFGPGSSPAKIATFLTAHCDAGLLGVNKLTDMSLDITAAEVGADGQKKAMIYAKDASNNLVKFVIPAPDIATEATEEGERVTDAAGATVCGYWGTMMGETITFVEGIILERE